MGVQAWFRWLARHGHLASNPAADLELPKLRGHYSLRDPLTIAEVEAVLAIPNIAESYGLRDRAILELFYATGIRRQELANLSLRDIEPARGCLHVRQGKGRKDRFVPVGGSAHSRGWPSTRAMHGRNTPSIQPRRGCSSTIRASRYRLTR